MKKAREGLLPVQAKFPVRDSAKPKKKFAKSHAGDLAKTNNMNLKRYVLTLFPSIFSIILFAQTDSLQGNSYDWQFTAQREAISPAWRIDGKLKYKGAPTLLMKGHGKEIANGHFFTLIKTEPLNYYDFKVHFLTSKVEDLHRCILARILWQDESGKQIGRAEYPATSRELTADKWNIIAQKYMAPEGSARARIELIYRWDADGEVRFGGISFEKAEKSAPRIVRLATVHHRPRNSKGPKENLEKYASFIKAAAKQKADIVCLPEGITLVGTRLNYVSASEPVPGPTTQFLGEIAKKHQIYIVAGILEKQGEAVYNTSVLIDRNGQLAGKYHKVSLPREEIEGGVTPGNSLPVFETDFGKIGMMICWDVSFPETARTLSSKGAEVIFLPIWGGNLTLAKARAIENQIYLVSSTYDMKSAVFNRKVI